MVIVTRVMDVGSCPWCTTALVSIGWVVMDLSSKSSAIMNDCSKRNYMIRIISVLQILRMQEALAYCGLGSLVHRDHCTACFGLVWTPETEL